MSIVKRRNIWWCDFTVQGERIRQSLATSDKEEAKRRHDKLKADCWDLVKNPARHTFADAVKLWMDTGEKDISDRYRLRAFNLLDTELAEITQEKLAGILTQYEGATRNRCINLITAVLNCAARRGWIPAVPHMARVKIQKSRTRWLSYEEWERLKNQLPDHLKAMATFAVASGLRENNVIGLKWRDVDLVRKVAWVHPDEAKAGEAIGVPLSDDAIVILREQIGRHDTYVFVYERIDKDGKKTRSPVGKTSTKAWKSALVRAGIDVTETGKFDAEKKPIMTSSFRWHDLRHTWASWHVMNGTPLEVLQKLGGWKTLAMVLRYAHLAPEYLASYANNSRHTNPPHNASEPNAGAAS